MGFPNHFLCESRTIGLSKGDHGWRDVGLERGAYLSALVSGLIGLNCGFPASGSPTGLTVRHTKNGKGIQLIADGLCLTNKTNRTLHCGSGSKTAGSFAGLPLNEGKFFGH
jgi:hypothetical protein